MTGLEKRKTVALLGRWLSWSPIKTTRKNEGKAADYGAMKKKKKERGQEKKKKRKERKEKENRGK